MIGGGEIWVIIDKPVTPAPLAQDEALAKRLWDVSAAMTGLAQASAA